MNANQDNHESTQRPAWMDALAGIGADWAKFGLSIGTEALERSARSLELAAKTLQTISKTFERETTTADNREGVIETTAEEAPSEPVTSETSQ
jgi:hypothetical protein